MDVNIKNIIYKPQNRFKSYPALFIIENEAEIIEYIDKIIEESFKYNKFDSSDDFETFKSKTYEIRILLYYTSTSKNYQDIYNFLNEYLEDRYNYKKQKKGEKK